MSLLENLFIKTALVDVAIQWICFAISWLLGTEKFYDLVGSSTFLLLTWMTFSWGGHEGTAASHRQLLQSFCVTIWAIRLGSYLFSRVLVAGEDRRFRKAKQNAFLFLFYWTVQAVWVYVVLCPTIVINSKPGHLHDPPLTLVDAFGYLMFWFGFLFEVFADFQKSRFRADPANEGKFISHGLWSISRHPNYFGEIVVWVGLFVPASRVVVGWEWLTMVSPLFTAFLLIKVSGIPLLERYADKKWGSVEAYQKYKAKTACLIPYVW